MMSVPSPGAATAATSPPAACLQLTGPAPLSDSGRRSSADDSLASVNGARSAVRAGSPTSDVVQFVPRADRPARALALQVVGAAAVVESWSDVTRLLR